MSGHDGLEYDLVLDTPESPDPAQLARSVLDAAERQRTQSL